MKKKMGRPALPKNTARGVLIGARFSPGEAERVQNAVKESKQTKSEWIRTSLLTAAYNQRSALVGH